MKKIFVYMLALALVLSMGLVMTGPLSTPVAAANGPPVETGLVLHVDASDVDSVTRDGANKVSAWADLSPEANDAGQATAAKQPEWVPDILFGKPIVRFDGTNTYMATGAHSPEAGQPNTLFVVWSVTASTGAEQFATDGFADSNRQIVRWRSAADGVGGFAGSHDLKYAKGIPFGHMVSTVVFDGANSEIYENGEWKATGNAGAHGYGGLTIGARHTGDQYFLHGDIAEILIYNRVLSDEEREEVEHYLTSKWLQAPDEVWACETGSDDNPGTEDYPFKTIKKGIDVVAEGGTVNVKAGTYEEAIEIDKSLTLLGAQAGVDARGAMGGDGWYAGRTGVDESTIKAGAAGIDIKVDDVTVDGFTITETYVIRTYADNIKLTNNIIAGTWDIGAIVPYTMPNIYRHIIDLAISCNWIKDTALSAFYHQEAATGLQIVDNLISDMGHSAVILGGSSAYEDTAISGNQIRRTQSAGINVAGGSQTGLTIENNIIESAGLGYTLPSDRGAIRLYSGLRYVDLSIQENDLRNSLTGINVRSGVLDWTDEIIKNNDFRNNQLQVWDQTGDVDLEAILANNTFDRAVVVRGSDIKVPTIFSSIQDAIDAADPGDTIEVAAGTYKVADESWDGSRCIHIDRNLTLRGAGSGLTILDAEHKYSVLNAPGEFQRHCTVIWNSASDVTIEGLTVKRGDWGIRNNAGVAQTSLTLTDVVVDDNYGNGIVFENDIGTATFTDCLAKNSGDFGIYFSQAVTAGTVTLTDTSANDNGHAGFSCQGSIANLSIRGGTFNNNTGGLFQSDHSTWLGPYYGFGIELRNCAGTITSVTAQGNGFAGPHIAEGGADYAGGGAGIVVKDGSKLGNGTLFEAEFENGSTEGNDITIIASNLQNNMNGLWIEDPDSVANWGACDAWEGNVAVYFSNIRDNQEFGVLNCLTYCGGNNAQAEVLLNNGGQSQLATHNWWGHISGPTHATNPGGTGDEVSDNVDFTPWLGAAMTNQPTGCTADRAYGEDASAQTDNVSADAEGGDKDTTVTIAEYVGNPTDAEPGFAAGAFFFDVHVGGPTPLPTQLLVEVNCPGGNCAGVVLKWFNGAEWLNVTPTIIVDGKVRATLSDTSDPTIEQLTGSPFVLGNTPPRPPTAGIAYPIWAVLLAGLMAGATLLALRRRQTQS